jgi:hypothetical protein
MRIISKYKDYYDGIQSLGMDSNLVFERFEKITGISKHKNYKEFESELWESYLSMQYINILNAKFKEYRIKTEFLAIGFCGRIYPCLSFLHIDKGVQVKRVSTYSTETTLEYINRITDQFGKIEFIEEYYQGLDPTKDDLDKYFNHNVYQMEYLDWFKEIEAPIFMFTENPKLKYDYKQKRWLNKDELVYIKSNFELKSYHFFKVKDSYTAFQELSQFLGGVLTKRETIKNNLSDKDKVKQYGFDLKYGFRTRPKTNK